MHWDPALYGRFAAERGRPFLDLLARVGGEAPAGVVDLGCGPGLLTALLAQRWPAARVHGIDRSEDMIATATPLTGKRLTFGVGDVERRRGAADVVISNATLQWIPGHRDLITSWARDLPAGGWLAFQVPGNFTGPSHTLIRELAGEWSIGDAVLREDTVAEPAEYASLLLDAGLNVDAWETTYTHVLAGADPVLQWVRGTALRPVLGALSPADGELFCSQLGARLRAAYPSGPGGTQFAFRRVFAVGHRA